MGDTVYDIGGRNYVFLGAGDDRYEASDPASHEWNVVVGDEGCDEIDGGENYNILVGGDGGRYASRWLR